MTTRTRRLGVEALEDRVTPADLSTFLTTAHVDLSAGFAAGTWTLRPRETVGPVLHNPDQALLVVGTNAREARPAGAEFAFVGVAAGAEYYRLPQTQNPDLLYLGVAGFGVAPGTFTAYDPAAESKGRVSGSFEWVKMTLTSVTGPGAFSAWQDDLAGPVAFMSSFNDGVSNPNANGLDTTDGISADDAIWILPGGHAHVNFGFTQLGRYEVTFRLSGRQGAATVESPPITTYFSVGNVGRFAVSPAAYTVNEGDGTASVTVTRTGGSDGRLTVNYATANGTAVAGQDYTATTGTLTFNDLETTKTISIPITDDTETEGDETFTLTLSSPGPASIAGYAAGIPGGSLLGSPVAATVTIAANDPNVPPTISDVPNQTVTEDVPLTVNFTVGDTQTPAANLVVTATGGTALIASLVVGGTGANRTVTITPAANAFGAAGTVTLSVSDGTFTTTDTFDVTVAPAADTPAVTPATTNEDTQSAGGLVITRNAADGVEVTHFKVIAVRNGTLFQNDGVTPIAAGQFITIAQGNAGLRFTPTANLNSANTADFGFDVRASLSASDAGLGGAVAAAVVTVNPVNDPPTATPAGNPTVAEDSGGFTQANFLTAIGGGPGESGQTVTISTANDNPTLFAIPPAISPSGTLTFTPAANAFGTATVTVTLQDDGGGTDTRTLMFTITVTPAADTPAVTGAATAEGVQTTSGLGITRNAADGAEVTHFKITNITTGSLFQNNGVTPIADGQFITFAQGNAGLRFTPAAAIGDGSFRVQASTSAADAGLGGAVVTATITVTRFTPVAGDDAFGVLPGSVVRGNLLFNDADPNGDPLTVTAATTPAHGTLAFQPDGSFTYTPGPTFAGTDTFDYTIANPTGRTDTATVTITGRPADPGIPVALSGGAADIGIAYEEGEWEPHIHEEETDTEFEPGGAIFHLRPEGLTPRPAGGAFDFLGVPAGGSFYRIPQSQNPQLIFLGFGGEELAAGDFEGDEVFLRVLAVDGPGHVSVWENTPGGPVVRVATADGLTGADTLTIPVRSHFHMNWGFSARGLYAVTVQAFGTLAGGEVTASDAATYYFAIDPANAAPTQTLPAAVTTPSGTPVAFTGANAVTAADTDPSARPARVTVTATNGTVSLGTTGVTFVTGDGTDDQTVTIEGDLAALNAALAGLVFTPAAGFSGPAQVTVTTDDGGFLVGETALTVTDTIAITVDPPGPPPPPPLPVVTVTTTADAAEPGTAGNLRFTRTGDATAVLTVTYTIAGTATAGTDYQPLSGTVAFAAGQTTVDVPVVVIDDTLVEGVETVIVTLTPGTGFTPGGTAATVAIADDDTTPPPPPASPQPVALGSTTAARLRAADGTDLVAVMPFGGWFAGGVRVARGDVTGDGTPDLIVGSGPGTASLVRVYDGRTGAEVVTFVPFEASFVGGVFLAAADFDGDGAAEVVVSPDEGGGPRVVVYSLAAGGTRVRASVFGFDDPAFRGGARVAAGDFNGDGVPDLAVAAGFLGGPRVAVLDGRTLLDGRTPQSLVNDFFAFDGPDATTLRNGVFVAAGDADGDGVADLLFGGGPGGGPRALVLSGAVLIASGVGAAQADPLANLFAGDPANRSGVRVAAADTVGDGRAELVSGAADGPRVSVYTIGPGGADLLTEFDAFAGPGGVFVG